MDPDYGNDTSACLQGSSLPCATFSYALSHVVNCLQVLVNASSIKLATPVHIGGVQGVVLSPAEKVGRERVLVSCVAVGAGLYFEEVNDTELTGLDFRGCSVNHPSADLVPTQDQFYPNITSALFFERCVNITLDYCSFTSSRGSGVSIFNSGGNITVRNSSFVNNTLAVNNCTGSGCYNVSVGLNVKMTYCQLLTNCTSPQPVSVYNSYCHYTIDSCTFYHNNNSFVSEVLQTESILSYSVHRTLSHGGGMEIRLEGQATGNTFLLSNCNFTRNVAIWGGGLEIGIGEDSSFNSVKVTSSNFSQNTGLVGGGIRMGVFPPTSYNGYGYEERGNVFEISNSTFEHNAAISAGAISFLSNAQLSTANLTHLKVIHSHFMTNSANDSGAAVAVNAWHNEIGGFPTYVEFEDCYFENNMIDFQVDSTETFGLGIITTEKIPLIFTGNTKFHGNFGSAVVARSTVVILNGSVDFENNWGLNGAGINLMSLAWIQLNPGVRVNFFNNHAFMRGGAIYSDFASTQVRNSSRYCSIRYGSNTIPVTEWNAAVNFDNNRARLDGASIFLSTPVLCYRKNGSSFPFTDPNVFHYSDENTSVNQIGSPPRKIGFGAPAVNHNGTFHASVMLGKPFQIRPLTDDFFNSQTSGSALVSLICDPLYPDQCNSSTLSSDFRLEGGSLLQLDNTERMTTFSIHGPTNDTVQNKTILLLLSNTPPSAMGYLHIDILPCKLGFTYNSSSGSCECVESADLACGFNDKSEACIKYGYWFGYTDNGNNSIIQHCSNDFCKYNNGYCPVGNCIRSLQGFCRLPDYDSDDLCEANRGGLLCSTCKKHHAFTFAGVQCVPDTSCSALHTVLLFLLNIVFWIILVLALMIALKFNLQIGSGNMYCLVYYFSVLQYLTNNYPNSLNAVVSVFSGFLQVSPKFFGLIPVCMFGNDVGPIYHAVLEFMHPLFIFIVILLLIVVTKRSPRLSRTVEFDGTKALCILLYFSFTSLVQTSLNLLDFTAVETDSSNLRVSLEPTVRYFDPARHLPWALLSIAILLLIVLPYILLLLLTPTLARTLRIKFIRFKPILDQYQACYRDKYRWFASYYLICRVVVFTFSLIKLGEFGSIFFLQMISIVILVVHTVIQPYRERWLNIVDSVLLADLAIYSLFNGSTAIVVLSNYSTLVREFFIHILILTPILYFIGLCYYSLHTTLHLPKLFRRLTTVCKRRRDHLEVSISGEVEHTVTDTTTNKRRVLEREPLLFSRELTSSSSTAAPQSVMHKASTKKRHSSSHGYWFGRDKMPSRSHRDIHKSNAVTRTSISPPR